VAVGTEGIEAPAGIVYARFSRRLRGFAIDSTVQIRDAAKARPSHYGRERVELSHPGMPSRARRIVVIVVYALGSYLALGIVAEGLVAAGVVHGACLHDEPYGVCTRGDHVLLAALSLAWIVAAVLCVGWGWRGRLWGARIRTAPSSSVGRATP
jgi:hypothetical protein